METSLHRQLKAHYAGSSGTIEVRLGRYRIDAVVGEELIEVQHGSLGAIRRKIETLLGDYTVRVVKPLVALKMLYKRARKGGRVVDTRRSPRRETLWDGFNELVYFRSLFPHPRLTLEFLLVEVDEWRRPGHGRRRRRRQGDFIIEDQRLVAVRESYTFRTAADFAALLDCSLPAPFHTGHLSAGLGVPRPQAQKIAYCLRHIGAIEQVGKARNALLYQRLGDSRAAA